MLGTENFYLEVMMGLKNNGKAEKKKLTKKEKKAQNHEKLQGGKAKKKE